MDGDDDVVAMASQGLVDGVVDHLEDQVVQARAVRRVTDVHAGPLAYGFQAFQDLDAAFAVSGRGFRARGHRLAFSRGQVAAGHAVIAGGAARDQAIRDRLALSLALERMGRLLLAAPG